MRGNVDAVEISVLPRCYVTSSGNLLPTFRDNLSVLSSGVKKFLGGNPLPTFWDNVLIPSSRVKKFFLNFLILEDGTDTLSRNVCKGLPLDVLRNIPEERRSHEHRGGSLKSRVAAVVEAVATFAHCVASL
jgi:hypothetical protein